MSRRIADILYRYRIAFFVISLGGAVTVALNLPEITFDTDYKIYFDEDNPDLIAHEQVEETFTQTYSAVFVIHDPKGVFREPTLQLVNNLTKEAWLLPYAERVDSISNHQHVEARGDDLHVFDLVEDPGDLDTERIGSVRKIALSEQILLGKLISDDGLTTAVNVSLRLPSNHPLHKFEVAIAARELRDKLNLTNDGREVHLLGQLFVDVALGEELQKDATTVEELMMYFMGITIALLLRSVVGAAIGILVTAATIYALIGIVGAVGLSVNGGNMPSFYAVGFLAVVDSIHLLSSYSRRRRAGQSDEVAMKDALETNLVPIFLTTLTTAIGFLGLHFSISPPFRELGYITATGLFIAFTFTLTIVPSLARFMSTSSSLVDRVVSKVFERWANFVVKNHKSVLISCVVVVVIVAAGIPLNKFDDNMNEYFSERTSIRQSLDFVENNLSGTSVIEYAISAPAEGEIANPNFLSNIFRFVSWLRSDPRVVHVKSYTDYVERIHKKMNPQIGDGASPIPSNQELLAQYLLFYDMSLPLGLDMNDQLSFDRSALRLVVTLEESSSYELLDFDDDAQAWLSQNLPDISSRATGPAIMFAHVGKSNIESMTYGNFLVTFLVAVTLIAVFRSIGFGLLCMIPNVVPAILAFGLWGYLNGEINLAVAIVFCISLGIVVDDTIHFVQRYRIATKSQRKDPSDAIRYVFREVGPALFATTLVLVVGFSVPAAFAVITANSVTYIMLILTLVAAFVMDFLLLPSLLLTLDKRSQGASLAREKSHNKALTM